MRISQKNNTLKKTIIIALALILISIVVYAVYASNSHAWPFGKSVQETTEKENEGTTVEGEGSNTNTDKPSTPTPKPTPETPPYVNTPITTPPAVGDSYPIENEHYKIDQNSAKSFNVTLYPIVNNPEYSDYDAQLKAYKNEVIKYLTSRYGSTKDLTIQWSPRNAADL